MEDRAVEKETEEKKGIEGRKKRKISLLSCMYLGVLVTLLLYTLFATDIRDMVKGYPEEHYINFLAGWKDEGGKIADIRKLTKFDGVSGLRLYNVLPHGIQPGESLNLTSHNIFFRVYLDNICIYSYDPRENYTGRGTGDVYHNISIIPSDAGKEIVIEIDPDCSLGGGARFTGAMICSARTFDYLIFRQSGADFILSSLIIFFGLALIVVYLGIYRENEFGYNLPALAISVILIGGWTMIESQIPQLVIGATGTLRTWDYTFLPLMIYPMIRFVNSLVKKPNPIYPKIAFGMMVTVLFGALFLRCAFGIDMHDLQAAFLLSYLFAIAIGAIILVNNHIYCLQSGEKEGIGYFYFGLAFLLVGGLSDMVRYLIFGKNMLKGNGFFLRLGLAVFIISMFIQILTWLTKERKTNRRDSFVNSLMQASMAGNSAEETIRQMLEYMGRETNSRRVYIYERGDDGMYYNTYAWDKELGRMESGALESTGDKEIIEDFYFRKFKESNSLMITDREQYKEYAPRLYRMLHKFDIKGMAVAPIRRGDEYIGFFGVVDPPLESLEVISGVLEILEYFISDAIRRRESERLLISYSYYDQMTGVKNRRALHEFETKQLDTSKAYGYVMCDINGLKRVNDNEGHEAGDRMITDVADALKEVYGRDNVYRMGGDEFAAYDVVDDAAGFANAFAKLQIAIKARGRSASLGYVFRSEGDPDYESVKKEADAMMYADKERHYAGRRDRRIN